MRSCLLRGAGNPACSRISGGVSQLLAKCRLKSRLQPGLSAPQTPHSRIKSMRRTFALLLIAAAVPLWSAQPVRARHGMVVTRERHATAAGLRVLKSGGNAVDAAVAVGFALAVTHPSAGNIGGGGFMLIRLADGRSTFIDFRERAPGAASRDMYIGPDGKA